MANNVKGNNNRIGVGSGVEALRRLRVSKNTNMSDVSSFDRSKLRSPNLLNVNNRRLKTNRWNFAQGQPASRLIHALLRRTSYQIEDSDDNNDKYFEYFSEGKLSANKYEYHSSYSLNRTSFYPDGKVYVVIMIIVIKIDLDIKAKTDMVKKEINIIDMKKQEMKLAKYQR